MESMSRQLDLQDEASNNNICEFVNCRSNKTTKIIVKAGEREITLKLCKVCLLKFEENDTLVMKKEKKENEEL